MSLSSSSSEAEVLAAYQDNACYEEEHDVTKAKAFLTACRYLLLVLPKIAQQGGRGGEMVELSTDLIAAQLSEARTWVARNDTTARAPRCKLCSLESFRGD